MLTGPAMRLFAILARAALFLLLRGRRRRWTPGRRRAPGRRPIPAPEAGSVIAGKAWVTDGDGLRVSGHRAQCRSSVHESDLVHKVGHQAQEREFVLNLVD